MAVARIGLEEWRSLLRSMWDLDPGARAALALVVLLNDLAAKAMHLRDEVLKQQPDLLDSSEFTQASAAMQALVTRVAIYADAIEREQRGAMPEVELTAWVAVPILDGEWPEGFPLFYQFGGTGLFFETFSGRTSASSSWVGDAQLAAYAYNKMLDKLEGVLEALPAERRSVLEAATGLSATFTEDTLRDAYQDAREQVTGPVREFLEKAADKAADIAKGAAEYAAGVVSTIAWGVGLALGGYLVFRLVESRRGR